MRILVLCEESQKVAIAFRDKGFDSYSCDILPARIDPSFHFQKDAIEVLHSAEWDCVIAFPPCQHLASSGARYFAQKRKDGRQQKAIDFVKTIWNCNAPFVCIENPVGILVNHLPVKPQYVEPWWFGHPYTKKTGLWLRGLPKLKKTSPVKPEKGFVHTISGTSKNARQRRSETFQGVADAMANQWGPVIARHCLKQAIGGLKL